MSKMDEILGPARAVVFGHNAGTKMEPAAVACGAMQVDKSKRTYYRRRDGLVTQRKWRTVSYGEVFFKNNPELWARVDTCRAGSTAEAVRIFKSRPTPEGAEPVKDGRHGA